MKDFWNDRYSDEQFVYGQTPNTFFRKFIDDHDSGVILLPADGEGRNGVYAAKQGWRVDAFDFSKEARKKALKLAEREGVTIKYHIADFESVELPDNHYDTIALIYAHMPSAIRRTIHRKLVDSLKIGGFLIMEAFAKDQIDRSSGGPKNRDMLYATEDLKKDFKALDIQLLEQTTVKLDEGKHHQGEGDVVRLIARK